MISKHLKPHWGRDKMDAISLTTYSSPFSWMKLFELSLKFVPKGPINAISSTGSDKGFAQARRQAIINVNHFIDAYMRHSMS